MKRYNDAKKVGIMGIIGNFFLFVIKFAIGFFSKSQSMIADSLNSLSDIFASFMTWLGNRISSVPVDSDHDYGHGKAEYIFSMLISISMMIISLKLLYDSINSIIFNNQLVFSFKLIIVCLITIIVKILLYLYTRSLYNKQHNLLVKANMIDHRNDIFITLFTALAIILARYGFYFVDGIVGIGISLWIMFSAIKIFKESYDILMDCSLDNESKMQVLKIIKSYDEVKIIGDLYSIPIGYNYIVVVTIFVDRNMHTDKSHDVTMKIEKEIIEQVERIEKVIVHVEPFFFKKGKKMKK